MKKTQPSIELLTASLFGILVDTSVFPPPRQWYSANKERDHSLVLF